MSQFKIVECAGTKLHHISSQSPSDHAR